MLEVLNTTKYIIMTHIIARLNLEQSHQQYILLEAFLQVMQ